MRGHHPIRTQENFALVPRVRDTCETAQKFQKIICFQHKFSENICYSHVFASRRLKFKDYVYPRRWIDWKRWRRSEIYTANYEPRGRAAVGFYFLVLTRKVQSFIFNCTVWFVSFFDVKRGKFLVWLDLYLWILYLIIIINFLIYKPGYKVSKILHMVYILAYRIHPSGKYLTLAIKPNVNHENDGQGVVSAFQNRVQPCLYCDSARIYETLDSNIL